MKEKFLPIGTVVILKGAKKRLMITGYLPIDMDKKNKIYDYVGCMYPEGSISNNEELIFDHENIDKIIFEGMIDEEQIAFCQKLKKNDTEEYKKKILEYIKNNS